MAGRYQIIGYDKDNDTEIILAEHADKMTAMSDAETRWKPLARDGSIRNLRGKPCRKAGEPFDWLIVRNIKTGSGAVISLYS